MFMTDCHLNILTHNSKKTQTKTIKIFVSKKDADNWPKVDEEEKKDEKVTGVDKVT